MRGFGALVLRGWLAGRPLAGALLRWPGGACVGPLVLIRKGHPGDSECRMFTCSCPALWPALGFDLPLPRGAPWELEFHPP